MKIQPLGLRTQIVASLVFLLILSMALGSAVILFATQKVLLEQRKQSSRFLGYLLSQHIESKIEDLKTIEAISNFIEGYIGLFSIEEIAIFNQRSKMIVNKVLAPHRQSITHLEIRGSKVQERFIRKQNKTYIRVWSPLRSQGWVIVFDISVESVFKKIAKAQKFIFLYVILAGGIIFIFGYLGLRRLVLNPLSSLARAIDKVRKGDISVEIETQKSKELFILSQGFNQMTSALRNRERELKEAHNQLIRTEKLASLGRLSAGIAHEIGNPTTAILGFLEMLSDNISEKERQDFLRRIRTETERINKIVRQLLEYSRPPTEEIGPVSVKKIIEETVDLVRVQKKFKDIKIKTIIPEDIPLVIGNSSKMVQVFLNLFFNSRDAMQGKGEIKVEVQEVQDQVNIQVIDTGPGIPPPILSEIFEPFFSTKNSGQGTGLGLAICQSIIEGFEGKISAKNSPQGGAIISIILKKSP